MKYKLIILLFLLSLLTLGAQEILFQYRLDPHFTIVERADYSKKLNGRYLGYVNREVRGIFDCEESIPGLYEIEGTWYSAQEIKKEGRAQALPLDHIAKNRFQQDFYGNNRSFQNLGGQVFRNFPLFPMEKISIGDRWEAPMSMIIKDLSGEQSAEIPLYCGYQFAAEEEYQGRKVYRIQAQFALRYRSGDSYQADNFLGNVSGSHVVSILIDKENLQPLIMRDQFQEEWFFRNGQTLEKRGFNLYFYQGVSLMNRGEYSQSILSDLGNQVSLIPNNREENKDITADLWEEAMDNAVSLYEREEGLTLSLNQLHFKPDLAELLPQDRALLDSIASSLSRIPEKSFLVRGHTADVGTFESQMILSMERAKTIVSEMVSRGIEADRFIYIGMGGSEPLGDNSVEEGRAMNRRVEITILED